MNLDNVMLSISCPVSNADLIKKYLEKHGCIYIDDGQELMNAKGLFSERTPSNMLIGARGKENITQIQLSELTGIPRRHISDMENGRRSIGKQNAIKLGEALNINYRLFL
jgi:DNA-binding XRE family transcriptional regulator